MQNPSICVAMKRLILLVGLPFSVSLGQAHPVSPFARAGIGTGTLGFDDATVKTLDGGVTLLGRISLGVEYMDLAGSSEFSRWTVGTVQLHLLPTSRRASPWVAAGAGHASARMPDDENTPSNRRDYRFTGSGIHSALGIDLEIIPHLFLTPSLSVKKTADDAEVQSCSYNYTTGQGSCGPWTATSHPFQTLELRIAIGSRY